MLINTFKKFLVKNAAVTFRREFTILFNRVAIFILLYSGIIGYDSLYVTYLDNEIGIYNGLLHSTAITHSFDLFIYIIAPIILLLTAFYARRIVQPIIPYNRFVGTAQNGLFSAEGPGYVKAYRNAVIIFTLLSFIIDNQGSMLCSDLPLALCVIPVVSYSNADLEALKILKENRGKSGVYRWTNLNNNKSYVGSGVNLSKRLCAYYSKKHMDAQIQKGKSAIYSALLKYGRNNFKLEILECCEPAVVLKREQHYINLLAPEYNILATAGSSLGVKHTEESNKKN
jgi:hypothetical protein